MKRIADLKSFIKENLFLVVFLVSALATLVVSTITILSMQNTVVNMNSAQENMDTTKEFLIRNYEYRLLASAAVAQKLLDVGDLDSFKVRPNSPDSPEAWFNDSYFLDLREKLTVFASENGLEYIYYYFRIDNYLQPLIDNDPDLETAFTPASELVPIDSGARDAWNDRKVCLATTGAFLVDVDGLMTAYAPIVNYYGEVAALVGIDIKDEQLSVLSEQIEALSGRTEALSGHINILIIAMIAALALLLTGGILTFIANRRRAGVLREALTDAEYANRAKSDFLATMSHEIRTPLNAILGITEIQLQSSALVSSARESLNKIYSSGELLLGIINDILDLSKIEAGKLELLIGSYDVASFVNDTAQLNMMRIGSKPIEFELEVDENLPAVLSGDELRVKQILNNLLSNAFKYTAKGMVRLIVSCPVDTGSGGNAAPGGDPVTDADGNVTLEFRVSDTGQGMTPEQVDQLFDEYSRFNQQANRTTEGTGLGMSITKNLIRMMNGSISVDSEPGKGSVFTVRIPQAATGSGVLGKELAENLQNFRDSGNTKLNREQIVRDFMPYGSVLIVDDVETNIFVASGLMAPYGLRIDSADSGFKAIDKVKEGNVYDVIFMDHMMPKMDGIEATEIIRGMGYDQPIVALTANAVVGQSDIFLSKGFDDFVSKPIDVRQLNIVLNKLVRDKQSPETLEEAKRLEEERDAELARQEAMQACACVIGGQAAEKQESAADVKHAEIDPRFAEIFARDAKKALAILEALHDKGDYSGEEDLRSYIINVHGMKSALANIQETDLSAVALRLETAGREGNLGLLSDETPAFLDSLRAFIKDLAPEQEDTGAGAEDEDPELLSGKLAEIRAACEEYDENAAESALADIRGMTWSQQTRDLLSSISGYLLHSDFDEAINAIEEHFS